MMTKCIVTKLSFPGMQGWFDLQETDPVQLSTFTDSRKTILSSPLTQEKHLIQFCNHPEFLLWLGSLLWLRFDPWSRNFCRLWAQPKKKKKKKKKKNLQSLVRTLVHWGQTDLS